MRNDGRRANEIQTGDDQRWMVKETTCNGRRQGTDDSTTCSDARTATMTVVLACEVAGLLEDAQLIRRTAAGLSESRRDCMVRA